MTLFGDHVMHVHVLIEVCCALDASRVAFLFRSVGAASLDASSVASKNTCDVASAFTVTQCKKEPRALDGVFLPFIALRNTSWVQRTSEVIISPSKGRN